MANCNEGAAEITVLKDRSRNYLQPIRKCLRTAPKSMLWQSQFRDYLRHHATVFLGENGQTIDEVNAQLPAFVRDIEAHQTLQ